MQGGRTVRPEVEGDGFDVSCLSVARRAAPWHIWIVITRVVVHKLEAIAPPHITTRPCGGEGTSGHEQPPGCDSREYHVWDSFQDVPSFVMTLNAQLNMRSMLLEHIRT